jgi:hypothetical protein
MIDEGVFAMVPDLGQVMTAGMNAANDKPCDDRISVSPAVSMLESGIVGNVKTAKQLIAGDEMDGRRVVRDLTTLISTTRASLRRSSRGRPAMCWVWRRTVSSPPVHLTRCGAC